MSPAAVSCRWPWLVLVLAVLAAPMVLPFFGLETISLRALADRLNSTDVIFWQLRVPRVLAGMLVGALLSVAGMAFQALFRNPLATPFTLGTASGASLGAAVYLWAGWTFALPGLSGVTLFAFAGALAALALVYVLSLARDGLATETMLLAGVAVSLFFSSLILLFQYLANQTHSLRILRWLMGGLDGSGYAQIAGAAGPALAGLVVLAWLRMDLNLLATGEDLAASRGMDVRRVKLVILGASGLMVGAAVSVAGPVGFIGLMVPHLARLFVGPDHRRLLPATLMLGAVFLPVCDTLARTLLAPAELPVGILTALLGGPFFIWLLLARAGGSREETT